MSSWEYPHHSSVSFSKRGTGKRVSSYDFIYISLAYLEILLVAVGDLLNLFPSILFYL